MATPAIREIVVPANERALNTAIMENQVQPEKIISVILQEGSHMRIGDNGPKYRVLYRP